MAYRVALLGIYHESNTFIQQATTIEDFKRGHWLTGNDIRKEYGRAFHEIGGMIEVLDNNDVELLPVMYAEATPGGVIDKEATEILLTAMFQQLEQVMPVDGCLVVPHGAAVSALYPDLDGHWLSLLRERVGGELPVIGTLDPHANVSEAMIEATDALVAYKTNPHIDQREVGREAASLMILAIDRRIKPMQHFLQLPLAISIEQQCTSREPCLGLYNYAASLCLLPGILSTSVILGFPYADVPEMGSSFIIVSDGKSNEASLALNNVLKFVYERKEQFTAPKLTIASQLPLVAGYEKPVLLLDMGDNIGGGSSGASTFLLDALEKYEEHYKSFICICDKNAVDIASQYSTDDIFSLSFGRLNENEGEAYISEVSLLGIVDGLFSENSPRHGGQVHFDMGKTAIVVTKKGNTVMLTSRRIPPFSLSQLTSFGINPGEFDVVVAKGVNAPVAAYQPVCKTMIQVDTPGVTGADMTKFCYKNRRKPLFPFELGG